ncbi:MAG TPA: DUF3105 domain-containing protein [Acidimicrobiales bacterium]|nr:DUF3105 domain-containing protein [Acidimicrobiales bacterium]
MRIVRLCGALSVGLALAAASLAGCGGKSNASSGCGQPFREPLNPNSLQHIINPASAKFDTDPPTSGPHLFSSPARGVVDRQLLPAEQVTILEAGDVLVQYRDPADKGALQTLRQTSVTIAPNSTLRSRVVATAWTFKLECATVDEPSLRQFIAAHRGSAAHAG